MLSIKFKMATILQQTWNLTILISDILSILSVIVNFNTYNLVSGWNLQYMAM